jgi:DNA adenine methylase
VWAWRKDSIWAVDQPANTWDNYHYLKGKYLDCSLGDSRGSSSTPFLRWAGGKGRTVKHIITQIPRGYYRKYYEPFLGGGAVFFALASLLPKPVLADINEDLINAYREVKDNVSLLIKRLRKFSWTVDEYYSIRESTPSSTTGKAARLIYLNRTCWNGLYRENKAGQFNVPFGREYSREQNHRDEELLLAASAALQRAVLKACDFSTLIQNVQTGDLVYLDPPYATNGSKKRFISYHSKPFLWPEQTRLARIAADAANRGATVLVSNGSDDDIVQLYTTLGFERRVIRRKATLAADATKRKDFEESLFLYKGHGNG